MKNKKTLAYLGLAIVGTGLIIQIASAAPSTTPLGGNLPDANFNSVNASNASGTAIYGNTYSDSSTGVLGIGKLYGVNGIAVGDASGMGIGGYFSGTKYGVWGYGSTNTNVDFGVVTAGTGGVFTGDSYGVIANVRKTGATALQAKNFELSTKVELGTPTKAIDATGNVTVSGKLSANTGTGDAVSGTSVSGYGVWGNSTTNVAVWGQSAGNWGVVGKGTRAGVFGESVNDAGEGVHGQSTSGYGVTGVSATGHGLHGSTTGGYGIFGTVDTGQPGTAGRFFNTAARSVDLGTATKAIDATGNVTVTGGITATNSAGFGISSSSSITDGIISSTTHDGNAGVFGVGKTDGTGYGVYGRITSLTGMAGYFFNAKSNKEVRLGTGNYALDTTGDVNVNGRIIGTSSNGTAVMASSSNSDGVNGTTTSNGNAGVFGVGKTDGTGYGIYGKMDSTTATAAAGYFNNGKSNKNVKLATGSNAIEATGDVNVAGKIFATTTVGPAVTANSTAGNGIIATSNNIEGIIGDSATNNGIYGKSMAATGNMAGVLGEGATDGNGYGVYGKINSLTGIAGYFANLNKEKIVKLGTGTHAIETTGPVQVSSDISAGGNISAYADVTAGGNINATGIIDAKGTIINSTSSPCFQYPRCTNPNPVLIDDSLKVNGNITYTESLYPSDQRLKDIQGKFVNGLEALRKLSPVFFNYKKDNALGLDSKDKHVGIIAQDLQKVLPEAVQTGEKGYLTVAEQPIIWMIANAVKDLDKLVEGYFAKLVALDHRVETLEKENADLKARLDKLEALVSKK